MSYVIQALLSNPRHPECGQIAIPFPIPNGQYDQTIERLQEMNLGYSVNRDCAVDDVDSCYQVLGALKGTLVNVDQLDYLAKRLDSFWAGEDAQFQAMAHQLKLTDIADFINLTFCCQRATVIPDFSDLERIGKDHCMNLNGGCMPTDEYKVLDGRKEALRLIEGGGGAVTPYGVVYDNGMVLEPLYNGRQFPAYLHDDRLLMALEITPKRGLAEGKNPEYLYLPASAHQIERTLLRIGVTALSDVQVRLAFHELPDILANTLDLDHLSSGGLPVLNRLCQAIAPMEEAEVEKLSAAVLMIEPSGAESVCRLAGNLEQFGFVPSVQTPEEYGRYLIRESGHFDYDENLEGFYDYRGYGEQLVQKEGGQFNECGYVVYQGDVPLDELIQDSPVEQNQQSLQMEGTMQ